MINSFLITLSLLFALTACMQNTNSHSNDDQLYAPNSISDPAFAAAFQVLSNKCINCHSGRHAHWAELRTQNAWLETVDAGGPLVVANDLVNSTIVNRLNFWGTIGGMPEADSNLTQEEYNAIKGWIQNL